MSDIVKIELPQFKDDRGTFEKLFNRAHPALQAFHIQQINRVVTLPVGTLRGLHYQKAEYAESKLFRVIRGQIQLVAFCIDTSSPYFATHQEFTLAQESGSILIPRGYATGYLVLAADTEVVYCSDNAYHPSAERGIAWNDPQLTVKWLAEKPILSEKDQNWQPFRVD